MSTAPIIDTDILSEVFKGKDAVVVAAAKKYLEVYGGFRFSLITQYEVLKGLHWKGAAKQLSAFHALCAVSRIEPVTSSIVQTAAEIWSDLESAGKRIGDADILVAATALHQAVPLVTGNVEHFARISNLQIENWREAPAGDRPVGS